LGEGRYEGVFKSFRTESIKKYTLTTINTRSEVTQRVIAAKLTRLTHKIAIQLHLVAESLQFAVLAPGGQSGNFWIHPRKLRSSSSCSPDQSPTTSSFSGPNDRNTRRKRNEILI